MAGRDQTPARRVKLTYDDFVQIPDDGMRHELIDGEHYVTPSPSTRHQRISRRLTVAIANWLEEHPVGEVFCAPFDVVFTRVDVVEPDLIYVSSERAARFVSEQHATGADLVVEISSPDTRRRDETVKLELYDREGVSEYWFVDAEKQVIRVYRRTGGVLGVTCELSSECDDSLTTPLLAGFHLSVSRLLRA